MSRAFVKESDGDAPDDGLPEKQASDHPNYVTADGLAQLRAQLDAALMQRQRLSGDPLAAKTALARFDRDIRYLQRRIDDAIVVRPMGDEVAIGSTVTIEIVSTDRRQTFTIVGEDQADPVVGKISWTSPLGRALVGARRGSKLKWERPIGDVEVVVTDIA